ncbi:MAG: hypothetical protein OEM85_12585 [Gammaproteobacteria bacterium]|nr:hypothetical protein [Gammaproteobacteria bacterium]MDH3410185.1 hypothetical protein [Gammaproteobacteria bacterium]
MASVTHDDIVRRFPGIEDHTVLEIEATKATAADLEAAWLIFQDDDEALIDIKQRKGSRLNRLLEILANSEIQLRDDIDE